MVAVVEKGYRDVSAEDILMPKDKANLEKLREWGKGLHDSGVLGDGLAVFKVREPESPEDENKINVDVVNVGSRKGSEENKFDRQSGQFIAINLSTFLRNTNRDTDHSEFSTVEQSGKSGGRYQMDFRFSQGMPISLQIKYP